MAELGLGEGTTQPLPSAGGEGDNPQVSTGGAAPLPPPVATPEREAEPLAYGLLALVGGGEWTPGCDFDARLVEASGADEVLVVPTASAFEHPERLVERAAGWFGQWGVKAAGLELLDRADAEDPEVARRLREAPFIYLAGASPLHLRSVLKDSAAWHALVEAWHSGAVLAASSAGAMVLADPMVDPRGGALTLGLGLLRGLGVFPHSDLLTPDKEWRTVRLATGEIRIVTIDQRTALLREPDGTWSTAGAGEVRVFEHGTQVNLDSLSEVL